jgi:hypothetical protein
MKCAKKLRRNKLRKCVETAQELRGTLYIECTIKCSENAFVARPDRRLKIIIGTADAGEGEAPRSHLQAAACWPLRAIGA